MFAEGGAWICPLIDHISTIVEYLHIAVDQECFIRESVCLCFNVRICVCVCVCVCKYIRYKLAISCKMHICPGFTIVWSDL